MVNCNLPTLSVFQINTVHLAEVSFRAIVLDFSAIKENIGNSH